MSNPNESNDFRNIWFYSFSFFFFFFIGIGTWTRFIVPLVPVVETSNLAGTLISMSYLSAQR